jgi:RNA polymerase sigma-70 factor (ECF subfamily)
MTAAPYACASTAWRKHHRELKGYLAHRLSDPSLADDMLQTVFLRALSEGATFCRIENQRAWLFQVARNAVADHLRLAKHHVPLPSDLAEEIEIHEPVEALAGCMERVMSELPGEDADVITQCDLQGMKLQKYADLRGLTLPAVKSRIQRARRRMRDLMTRNCRVTFDDTGRVCCHVPRAPA